MRILVRAFTYLNERTDKYIPVPPLIEGLLNAATTAQEVNDVLKRNERALAKNYDDYGEFLSCDNVAGLMIQVLRSKGIPARGVLGYSDEGSSHVWVEVNGKRYDATEQGCWTDPPKVDPSTGFFVHRGELAKRHGK